MRWVWAAVVVIVGCSDHHEPPPAVDQTNDGIDLMVAGFGPRSVLHYQLAKGISSTLAIELDHDLVAPGMGGRAPTSVTELQIAVDDVQPDGGMKIRTTIAHVSSRDRAGMTATRDAFDRAMASLEGISYVGTLAPDGRIADLHVDATGKQLPPALAKQIGEAGKNFQELTLRLPHEPVGVGALWRYTGPIGPPELGLVATSSVMVTSIEGTKLGFTLISEAKPGAGGSKLPPELAGFELSGAGVGVGVVDLSRMVRTGSQTFELRSTGPDAMAMTTTTRYSAR
ncbi:MAG: hypothetical protein AB7P03_18110 [Kofleriaceae bacterium]